MDWYYVVDGERAGPVDDAGLSELVRRGVVLPVTLVWNATFSNWTPYGDLAAAPTSSGEAVRADCDSCGMERADDELVRYDRYAICGACAPLFFQRVRQGGLPTEAQRYGGFWIRLLAKIIDLLLIGSIGSLASVLLGLLISDDTSELWVMLGTMVTALINVCITVGLTAYFVGRFGATPGKMACGLRVVLSDGGRVTYLRALCRSLGEIVSGLILYIGYLMAAFDDERRTLHDHFCDTRVVRV